MLVLEMHRARIIGDFIPNFFISIKIYFAIEYSFFIVDFNYINLICFKL